MLFWQLRSLDDKLEDRNNSIFANGVILTISQYLPFFEVEVSTGTQWSFLWKPVDLVGIVEYAFWLKNTELG